jgi:hypothetical protein
MGKPGGHLGGIAEVIRLGWFYIDGYPGFGLDDRIIRWVNHVTIEPLLHQLESSILRRYTVFSHTFETLINLLTINTNREVSTFPPILEKIGGKVETSRLLYKHHWLQS